MLFNASTPAERNRQIAALEAMLLRQEVRLTRRVRREIMALWRRYNDLDVALREFQTRIAEILEEQAAETAQRAAGLASERFEENDTQIFIPSILIAVAAFSAARALEAAEQIAGTEADNLRNLANRLASEGATSNEILAEIRRTAPTYSAARARLIAETETAAVSDKAFEESLLQTGLQVSKRTWIATRDNRTREEHRDAHGQEREFGEPFLVGGELLRYPRDPNGSIENTIRCRCQQNIELGDA